MKWLRKHKAVVVLVVAGVLSFVFIGRYALFYQAMYRGWLNQVKTTELHEKVSVLIHNIELYITEEQSDSERPLRFMYENASQCEQAIKQLTSFCEFVVTERGNLGLSKDMTYHNRISSESFPGLVKTSDNLTQGLRIFQGVLGCCMDDGLTIEDDKQLKKYLSMVVQQFDTLSTALMEHDFTETEGDIEFIACYLCFLDESDVIALDLLSAIRGFEG